MEEDLLKTIQKFLNTPFKYSDLLAFTNKQKDFLLNENVSNSMEEKEYNAVWDTVLYLEDYFTFGNNPNLIIGCQQFSVQSLFEYNLKWRKSVKK